MWLFQFLHFINVVPYIEWDFIQRPENIPQIKFRTDVLNNMKVVTNEYNMYNKYYWELIQFLYRVLIILGHETWKGTTNKLVILINAIQMKEFTISI